GGGADVVQQRARQQRQANAARHRWRTPRPWPLHRTRPLGDKEVGLDGPAVARGDSDLYSRQLAGGRADQQGTLVSRVIHAHDIKSGLGSLAEVQVPPTAHSYLAVLDADCGVFLRPSLGALRPGMQHRPMPGGATALAWALGMRSTAQGDVPTQAPHQRIALSSGLKPRAGGNARIHTEQALLRARRQSRKELGYSLLARGPKAGTAHQADSNSPTQDHR